MSTAVQQGMTYAAAGASLVAMSVWLAWSFFKRAKARNDAEGTIDSRVTAMLNQLQKVYDQIVNDQRRTIQAQDTKIGELHQQLRDNHRQYTELMLAQQRKISDEVAMVREEGRQAIGVVREELAECKSEHARCHKEQQQQRGEINVMREAMSKLQPVNVHVGGPPS